MNSFVAMWLIALLAPSGSAEIASSAVPDLAEFMLRTCARQTAAECLPRLAHAFPAGVYTVHRDARRYQGKPFESLSWRRQTPASGVDSHKGEARFLGGRLFEANLRYARSQAAEVFRQMEARFGARAVDACFKRGTPVACETPEVSRRRVVRGHAACLTYAAGGGKVEIARLDSGACAVPVKSRPRVRP